MRRKSVVVAFFLLFSLASELSAQTSVSEVNVVISSDKMNVLYIGVDNPVSIAVPGVAAEKISAELTKGVLTEISPGRYTARVPMVDFKAETKVKVFAEMQDGGKQLVEEVRFRVHEIPPPLVMVGWQMAGDVEAELFQKQKGIIAAFEGFDGGTVHVVRFEMTYAPSSGRQITLATDGATFSPEMKELISNSKKGDKFIFEKIMIEFPENNIRKLEAAVFNLI